MLGGMATSCASLTNLPVSLFLRGLALENKLAGSLGFSSFSQVPKKAWVLPSTLSHAHLPDTVTIQPRAA